MAKTLIEAIGFKFGQKAAQAKNAFDLMGGDDEESLRAEVRLGRDMRAALLERVPLMGEDESSRFVVQIGRWLLTHLPERKVPFSFLVTAEEVLHTFALPGGSVFISWPLLQLCCGERDEIAFLLAHEMAHIVHRHTLNRIVKDAALSLLLRQTSGRLAAASWLGDAGRQVLTRAFSKEEEFEADIFAISLLKKAGGDPGAGENLLRKLAEFGATHDPQAAGAFLATHPPISHRIARLQSLSVP